MLRPSSDAWTLTPTLKNPTFRHSKVLYGDDTFSDVKRCGIASTISWYKWYIGYGEWIRFHFAVYMQ